MKKLRKLSTAATLVFVLSVSTLAGDISTGAPSPQHITPPDASTATNTGDISTGARELKSSPLIVEISLNLLQLLSVF